MVISQNLAFSGSRSLFKDKRIHVSLESLTRLKHSFEYKDVARPKWYKYSGFQIEKEKESFNTGPFGRWLAAVIAAFFLAP